MTIEQTTILGAALGLGLGFSQARAAGEDDPQSFERQFLGAGEQAASAASQTAQKIAAGQAAAAGARAQSEPPPHAVLSEAPSREEDRRGATPVPINLDRFLPRGKTIQCEGRSRVASADGTVYSWLEVSVVLKRPPLGDEVSVDYRWTAWNHSWHATQSGAVAAVARDVSLTHGVATLRAKIIRDDRTPADPDIVLGLNWPEASTLVIDARGLAGSHESFRCRG